MRFFIKLLGLCSVLLANCLQGQEIKLFPRQMVIFQKGVGEIKGTLFWGIDNGTSQPKKFKSEIMLPKETHDFFVIEGIKPENIRLNEQKKMILESEFLPGSTMVILGFLVKGSERTAEVTFTTMENPPEDLLIIWPKKDELGVFARDFIATEAPNMGAGELMAIKNKSPLVAGNTFTVTVDGIEEGRGDYWLTGAVFISVLFLLATLLALRSYRHGKYQSTKVDPKLGNINLS